jgi:primosomal protein N' (replication factor Y)
VPHSKDLPPGTELRDVLAVLDDEPFVPATVVELALWVGEYYMSGPGDVLALAMPPMARTGSAEAFRRVAVVRLLDLPAGVKYSAQQQGLIDELRRRGNETTVPELLSAGVSSSAVHTLARRGLVSLRKDVRERDPFRPDTAGRSPWSIGVPAWQERTLTDEQANALDRLQSAADGGGFRTVLLHGVTGSGKTEIYLRLAAHVIERGDRVLVLVPEIALTPAVAGLFVARFGARVAIQHSGLAEGERHDQWHRIRRGDVDVVVGTRSAVFAPVARLGLVIVDEEHEAAYKQEETPRYHGRDVAVVRGQREGALVVLASATPSLESAMNAEAGKYDRVVLSRRVLDRPLATVRIVDMRPEYARGGGDVTLSANLVEAVEQRLARKEQSLVLLNRRGFATVVFCRQCAASMECPHCSVSLTYHRAARRLRCHYCNYATAVPTRCGSCGGEYLEQAGFGTERLEAEIKRLFPAARTLRVDRDTVRRRGAIARALSAVAAGAVDILVGTQMIAKGHDFPAVTLVGVVSADVGLGLADFRASERTFQLLTQVIGRAGRGHHAGEAIVQTLYPDHYSVRAAAAQDYRAFFTREAEFRRSLDYPPTVALINVVVKGRNLETALSNAQALVEVARRTPGAKVLGPAPAPIAKVKGEYRAQFFLKGGRRHALRAALTSALEARPDLKRRTIVDVDPMSTT